MDPADVSRRGVFRAVLAALGGSGLGRAVPAQAAPAELRLPPGAREVAMDLDAKGIEGWTVVDGEWTVEEMSGAPGGKRVLVQRATRNPFNLIVAPPGPAGDVDVAVKFLPISGREDASGGIVFRFHEGRYYVVRANALEDNFRLYYFDRGRRQIATATREATGPRAVAFAARGGGRRSPPGMARRGAAPGPSRRAVRVRSRRALDEGRLGHRVRRSHDSLRVGRSEAAGRRSQ